MPLRRGRSSEHVELSIELDGDAPPTEFRIFSAGKVDTKKGVFVFDADAAKSVIDEWRAHGADLMIDYDHASLSDVSLDPATSGKAAGWFDLELRNGELWAVNVRWCAPAAEALRRKEWRYMSPAFATEDGHVTRLLNVAITNLPATRRLQPLVAASAGKTYKMASDSGLNPKLVSAALAAVASKDAKGALSVLQQILAAMLGGSSDDAAPSSADVSSADPADPNAQTDPTAASAPKDEAVALAGASRVAMALTGKLDPAEALAELTRRSRVAVDLEAREVKLAAERAVAEAGEYRVLAAELVKLGADHPADAWSDAAGTVPCARILSEPIASLRARVARLSAARGFSRVMTPVPPTAGAVAYGLSEEQIKICKEMGVEPEAFAALAAQRDSVKTGKA